jgi:hypothetical protein
LNIEDLRDLDPVIEELYHGVPAFPGLGFPDILGVLLLVGFDIISSFES